MRASDFWNSPAASGLFDPGNLSSLQAEPLQDCIVAQVTASHRPCWLAVGPVAKGLDVSERNSMPLSSLAC